MEMKEFRTLLEIEKVRSISLAAKSLYISQPGLSQFLQNYEREIGFAIFERGPQGVRPTVKGRDYLALVRRIVEQYDAGLKELRGTRQRGVRFGIGDQRGALLIPVIMSKLKGLYPEFRLEINDTISSRERLLDALKDDIVDAACTTIINEDYGAGDGIRIFPLVREEIVLVVPLNHGLLPRLRTGAGGQYWVEPGELCGQTYILCDHKREIRKMSDQIFWNLNITHVNILQSSTSLFTVINSCQNCNALTFSPWEYVCDRTDCLKASLGREGVFWTHILMARPGAFQEGELELLKRILRESLITDMKNCHGSVIE